MSRVDLIEAVQMELNLDELLAIVARDKQIKDCAKYLIEKEEIQDRIDDIAWGRLEKSEINDKVCEIVEIVLNYWREGENHYEKN